VDPIWCGYQRWASEYKTETTKDRVLIARTQEAHAYVGVARSDYYPLVGFEAGAQRDLGVYKYSPALDLPTAGASTHDLFLGGLSTRS
jgi:outer membrane protein TolC